eukprot:TRINITY_DN55633_c0_g1_i1.p1 TRINITY_DN55633_c0_g1~~TRINITY_DN55633_c0_g1_i1.p1  ORF type:complete len:151 (+),score=21.83 TRINITY_DN55633_c0_g1_i1:78-530(+)
MASNSLRGGKNIYGSKSLMSNWAEERLEPNNQEAAKESQDQLPSKTSKTWSKTSEEYGIENKEGMRRAVIGTETGNWLQYQKVENDAMYQTTTGSTHCDPNHQSPAFQAPYIPEEKISDYRETWTSGDKERFERSDPGRGTLDAPAQSSS